ncbi:MAG TPA: hypothetical protein ENI83_00050 [Gammaproteobacteria bacterium]|nr:hypothetical protein [Gammaproteobacteria bacterium]
MSILAANPAAAENHELKMLWKAARDGHYLTPGSIELQQATALFKRELLGDASPQLQQAWQALGWQRTGIQLAGHTCQVLHESAGRREGRGFYLFCTQVNSRTALQAPHSFKDLQTGYIALAMANSARFRVVAWNTVPRYSEDEKGRHDADLAHLTESYFTALTRALATDDSIEHVIQLHGFSRQKRNGDGKNAAIILSNGTRQPDPSLLSLASRLRETLDVNTRVFPYDIRELGALTNRQGRLLREAGHTGFIHIELSSEMRKQLRNDKQTCRIFLDSLPGTGGTAP